MSKYGVFPGPYFVVFVLNTEIYEVNLRIQSKYGKMRIRKSSVFGDFLRSVYFKLYISIFYFHLKYSSNLCDGFFNCPENDDEQNCPTKRTDISCDGYICNAPDPKYCIKKWWDYFTPCKKGPNTEFFWPVFSRIWTDHRDLRSKSPYSVRIRENTDQKKLRIWTLFTQCLILS